MLKYPFEMLVISGDHWQSLAIIANHWEGMWQQWCCVGHLPLKNVNLTILIIILFDHCHSFAFMGSHIWFMIIASLIHIIYTDSIKNVCQFNLYINSYCSIYITYTRFIYTLHFIFYIIHIFTKIFKIK